MEIEALETNSLFFEIPHSPPPDQTTQEIAARHFTPPANDTAPPSPQTGWSVREQSRLLEAPGPELPHGRIGGMNGVGTYLEEATVYVNQLNQYSGGYRAEWVFNCPYTALADIV